MVAPARIGLHHRRVHRMPLTRWLLPRDSHWRFFASLMELLFYLLPVGAWLLIVAAVALILAALAGAVVFPFAALLGYAWVRRHLLRARASQR